MLFERPDKKCLWYWLAILWVLVIVNKVTGCPGNQTVCLVGGSSSNEGNIKIGRRFVCDDSWGMEEAAVTCRQLGYPGVVRFSRESEFGMARNIGFDDFECTGEEARLQDCYYKREHDCSHTEVAGVVCAKQVEDIVPDECRAVDKVCLIGGPDQFSGNVYFEGRPVCDMGWDFADGYVTCRQLGFGPAINTTTGGYFGACLDYFSMISAECEGNEDSLTDCEYTTDSGTCRHTAVAGVVCTPTQPQTSNHTHIITGVLIGVGCSLALVVLVVAYKKKTPLLQRSLSINSEENL